MKIINEIYKMRNLSYEKTLNMVKATTEKFFIHV